MPYSGNINLGGMINAFGQDVRETGDGTYIGPDGDAMEKERQEREAEERRRINQPPPKVDEGIILKGPDPSDIEDFKLPPTPYPEETTLDDLIAGGGFPIPEPKTLDDYILTMSDEDYTKKELEIKEYLLKQGHDEKDVDFFLHTQFYPERSDSFLKDIKTRSDRFLETYNEPLTRDPSQERASVKSRQPC